MTGQILGEISGQSFSLFAGIPGQSQVWGGIPGARAFLGEEDSIQSRLESGIQSKAIWGGHGLARGNALCHPGPIRGHQEVALGQGALGPRATRDP